MADSTDYNTQENKQLAKFPTLQKTNRAAINTHLPPKPGGCLLLA